MTRRSLSLILSLLLAFTSIGGVDGLRVLADDTIPAESSEIITETEKEQSMENAEEADMTGTKEDDSQDEQAQKTTGASENIEQEEYQSTDVSKGDANNQGQADPQIIDAEKSEETSGSQTESQEKQSEEDDVSYPKFYQEKTVSGVRITVSADEGVFPEGSSLSVKKVSRGEESRVDNAISGVREGEVVSQYTFDIKILKDGMEIQPRGDVSVSFKLEEVENTNLETSVYHVDREYNVNSMDIEENEGVVTVVTDGFSIYTVEFTYGDKQFVLAGDWYVKLEDLLYAVDLSGEVSSWEISDEELFDIVMGNEDGPRLIYTYISDGVPVVLDEDDENYGKVSASYTVVNDPEGDVPWVVARKPFTSEEWLDVTMDDGITYRIVVTDAIMGNNTVNQNIPGLSQGENLTNFAPLIPVADIWIDSSKFYAQSGFVNGTWDTFEPGPLMTAENSPFKVDNPAGSSKASSYQGRHFVYYDSSVKPLDGYIATTRKSDGATVYQSYNYFEGRVGTYTWRNAAVRLKEDGTEERLHVCIDYSNPLITLQPVKGATSEANFIVTDPENINSWNDVNVGLFGGNAVTAGAKKYNAATDKYEGFDERYGLQITAKPYVIDDNGNVVNAKIYFPMVDLDVNRSTGGGFAGFYKGNSLLTNYDETLRRYSEGAQVNEGLVLNSSGDRLYIPGSDGTYKSIVGYDNGSYRVSSGPTGDVDPGTFNTGFLALIQNGEFKTTVTGSGGTNGGSVITYVMAGSEYNYRLRHSTETLKPDGTSEADGTKGGTIRTTREGNHNGELNDGQIIEPSMIASAVGQTIVYTFTPEPGYALNAVYVWNDTDKTTLDFPSIDSMKTLTKIREGDGTNNTFVAHDDNHDGIVDRYTYSFVAINEDNAIHVVWVKTSLSIRKAVTGSGATNDTFTFTIKAWGDSDEDGVIEYVDFANDSDMGALASEFTSVGNNLYQFTLESGETINIPEGVIPFGFEYEVEEIQVNGKYGTLDGWSPVSATVQSGQLTDENPHGKANFTNRRKKTTDPNKTLTVKKVWSNDIETIRPRNITVNVQNEIVALNVNSYALRNQIESLFGGQTQMRNQLTGFRYGTKEDAENATQKYVFEDAALTYGTIPVYIYKDGTDICIYSDAEIYFDGSMDNLFYECRQLTDISGLANIHTDFVTSFAGTFGRCINLTNLAPLADWNVTSATSMSQMFIGVGISEANKMTLSDLTPLADWDTRNVTNMSQMFRYSNVADLSPIAGWDVGRVTTMIYMFQHTKASTVDNRALDEWDPGLCTGWTAMFQYSNNTSNTALTVQQRANLPVFTKRTGTWSSAGAYQNVQGTHQSGSPSTKPTDAKTSNLNQKGLLLSQTAHDVDPSDPTGNTWIYEFEIPEGAYWKVWEVLPDGYAPYYSIDEVTYQAPGKEAAIVAPNENGQFGSADNPLTGAVPQSVTVIKNKRNTHELRIKKDAASSTNEKFTFTLRLWSVSESNTYDLPDNHPKLLDGSIKKIAPGTYEFTLIPPGSEALILPAGIRYRVTETPAKGWSLISEHDTYGLLNRDKEASFVNARHDTLKVIKIWENDYDNNVVMSKRPTGQDSLGIKVVTQDKTTRWKQTGPAILTDIVGTQPQQDAYNSIRTLYNISTLIPELKSYDGTTDVATTAPRRIYIDSPVGVITTAGDYVVDTVAGNTGQLTVYPVENVPFEHTYTQPDHFTEDDGAGQWIYEFNISTRDDVLSVEETNIPSYYQKLEAATDVDGRVVYNVVNTLDVRDLEIKKETVDDEPGLFQYGIKFYFDTDTSKRHPIKVGHSQLIEDEDGSGEKLIEYELFFANGVTFNGKDISGLNERINDEITGKLTETEGDAIINVLKDLAENAATKVNGVDSEFTRHHATTLTLADLGISWNGQNTETIYVEQDADVVGDMFTTGRRLDWFIIPTPGNDEVISVRTPYTLRRETTVKNGITYPKQIPNNVTGADGTYYFTLRNGEKIVFNDLPVGVTYEIVEMKKVGWDLVESVNSTGTMDDKNDNSGKISEVFLYNGNKYSSRTAAENAALSAVSEATSGGNTVYTNTAVYSSKDDAVAASIIKNHDNTWAYQGASYSSYDDAKGAADIDAANGRNNDNTYTYNGTTYYTLGAVEGIACERIIVVDNDGTPGYQYGGMEYSSYDGAADAAKADVTVLGSGSSEVYVFDNVNYPSYEAALVISRDDIIDNQDGTYTYNGTIYNSAQEAEDAAVSAVTDNQDSTYTYDGETYSSLAEAQSAAAAKISANDDSTYVVNRQTYSSYNAAKTAAESLITTDTSATGVIYSVNVSYDSIYDAEKAAKLAVTKEPYEPRRASFKNEREKGTIKVVKETVNNEEGEFTFRMMTGRVVKSENIKDKNGNPLAITRKYPEGESASTVNINKVETHTTYTEYTTVNGDVYKLTDEIIGGKEVRKVYKNNNEITTFNMVYPQEFTDMTGMNYKFVPITTGTGDSAVTTWKMNIETTTFEFKLKNDEFATISGIPFDSKDRILEISDELGSPIGEYWELVSIDGDQNNTKVKIDSTDYYGIDTTMRTDDMVTHTFLNKKIEYDLGINKETVENVTGSFNFKIKVSSLGLKNVEYRRIGSYTEDSVWQSGTFQLNGVELDPASAGFYDLVKNTIDSAGLIFDGTTHISNGAVTVSKGGEDYPARAYKNGTEYAIYVDAPGTEFTDNGTTTVKVVGYVPQDLNELYGLQADADDHYKFTLNNGATRVFENLPKDSLYEVYEETKDGWRLIEISNSKEFTISSGAGGTNGILTKDTTEVFTNLPLYDLTVTKTVAGNMGDKEDKFEFNIKVYGWKTVFTDTVAEMPENNSADPAILAHDHNTVYEDLYTEIQSGNSPILRVLFYDSVLEQNGPYIDDSEWTVLSAADTGRDTYTLFSPDSPVDLYGNMILDTDSEVNANLKSRVAAGSKVELQRLEILDLSEYGGTDNGDGSYKFTLGHNGSVTIDDIPVGYSYEIEENDYSDKGYVTSTALTGDVRTGEETGTSTAIEKGNNIRSLADSSLRANTTAAYTNRRSGAIPTEVFFSWLAALGLLLPAALYGIARLGKKKEKP